MSNDNICVCCLIRPPDNDLKVPYMRFGKQEIYGDMLKDCFKIQVTCPKNGDGICKDCVLRLQGANDFKQQVLQCQRDLERAGGFNVKDEINIKVKHEIIDDDNDDNGIYVLELKEETDDFDLQDDTKLSELFGLKKRSSDKGKKKSLLEKVKKESKSKKLKEVDKSLSLLSDSMKHKLNVETLMKYSNCTPFLNRSIAGINCAFCRDNCANLDELKLHQQENHKNDTLITSKKLDKHNLSVKMDITNLQCKICLKNFDFMKNLKQHLIKDHSIKFYQDIKDYILEFKLTEDEILNCALCNSTFETFKMLLQHMNGHYRNYICKVCDIGFINKHKLSNHERTHDIGTYSCSFCDKIFSTRVRKLSHEKHTHTANARYNTNCPHCEKTFTSYYRRNRHMSEVHNILAASYKCNICDKSFLMKSKLTYHIKKVHLMERNHICAECGQGFFIKQSLDEHMIKHKGEKVFKCMVCNKAYARKKTLREHMRIHNNDRRFKCGICLLAFVQKCSLKSHMLSNHGITLAEFDNTKNYDEDQHSP